MQTVDTQPKNDFFTVYRQSYPPEWDSMVIMVFADMAAYANSSKVCFATQETIANDCGCCISTVKSCIKYLLECEAIEMIKKGRHSNSYSIVFQVGEQHLPKSDPRRRSAPTSPPKVGVPHLSGRCPAPTESKGKQKEELNKKDLQTEVCEPLDDPPPSFDKRRITKPKSTQPDDSIPEDDPIKPEPPKKASASTSPHKILFSVFRDIAQSIPDAAMGRNVRDFRETYKVTKENVEDIANVLRDFYTPETGIWETVELGWNSAGCFHHNRPTPHQIVLDFEKVLDFSIDGDKFAELQDAINGSMSPKGDIGRGLAKNFYSHFKKNVSSIDQLVDLIDSTFSNEDRWLQWRFSDGTGGEPERDYWLIYNTLEHVFKERNQTPAW